MKQKKSLKIQKHNVRNEFKECVMMYEVMIFILNIILIVGTHDAQESYNTDIC